ncbi:gem-associated protein 5-like [Styela clava]
MLDVYGKIFSINMVVLPSSPVWYQSRGIDTSHNGILAFGSRNLVFLLDLTQKRAEIYGILSGHTDKVTTCSFCPTIGQDQLLRISSGADDCSVKVWDVRQKLMLHEQSAHGSNKIISVHWSPVNPSLILSGDEKGFVVCWNLDKGSTDRFYPDGSSQMHLGCLTCSPHNENIVAIGYKSGAVSLMDIRRNGTVIKKLRGHTNEVHSIVWSPFQDENLVFSSKGPKDEEEIAANGGYEGVIATGSKDKTIKLWSIGEGKCRRTLKIPNTVKKGRKTNEDVARLYSAIHWPQNSKTKFISSGYNGDLVVWDISPGAENLFEVLASQTHDAGHHRIVFNIAHGSNLSNSIVTTSMDRQLLHWTIPSESASASRGPDWVLPTLGGFVYSISVSPKDPSMIAVGVGDGMIRVWKTRSPKSAYDITTLWQGIKEKVMALAWHPNKEGCLAFATEDGKVGIYDTLSLRPPVVAETYHMKPVYALSWGPKCSPKLIDDEKPTSSISTATNKNKNLHLFSCGGDGKILQHNPSNMSKDAVDIDQIISSSNSSHSPGKHSEVSWNQDESLLAIGNDNGTINIYLSPHLNHILEIKSHSKIVNCVKWRPNDEETNNKFLEIVTGSNNSIIHVHDLKKIFLENEYTLGNELENPILVSKPHRSLVGHLSRITGLSYNPRNTSQIVSSSYDSTAQVWDTETEKPLHNFRGHHGRLMCVIWSSVIDEQNPEKSSGIIYTGADDYTVHGWYAEDQQHTEPVKALPDFGFGPKNKFQNKKKGRNKKTSQNSTQPTTSLQQNTDTTVNGIGTDKSRDEVSIDLNYLLEKKKAELLATINCDLPVQENENVSVETKTSPTGKMSSGSKSSPATSRIKLVSTQRSDGAMMKKSGTQPDDDLFGRRKRRLKNMFPQSVTMDNRKKSEQHQDCIKIVQWNTKQQSDSQDSLSFLPGSSDNINLGFYTDRKAAFRMMKNEADKLQGDEITEGNYNLRIWMGDIVGTIEDAKEKMQLTDQLVAMAPIAGQAFWRKTAHAFAKQLIAEDHHLHAVHYLLVCDKVQEAIQVLLDSRHYREAVALAKARLCDDDPLLKKTVGIWGQKLKSGGSVELAAKCFAAIGDFKEASASLAQRATSGASTITDSDVSSLWAAASVAKTANEEVVASGYANRALQTVCLRTWNWLENNELLSAFHNLKAYRFISVVHEILVSRLIRKAGLRELPTTRRSNWNGPDFYHKDYSLPSAFHDILFLAWGKHAEESGDSNASILNDFNSETIIQIHNEAMQYQQDNPTESRISLQVAVSLAAAICTSPTMLRKHVVDSDSISENIWIKHAVHTAVLLSKSQTMNTKILIEILSILCEIISWIKPLHSEVANGEAERSKSVFNGAADLNTNVEMMVASDENIFDQISLPYSEIIKHGVHFLSTPITDISGDLSKFLKRLLTEYQTGFVS